jgi:hypothetical protein
MTDLFLGTEKFTLEVLDLVLNVILLNLQKLKLALEIFETNEGILVSFLCLTSLRRFEEGDFDGSRHGVGGLLRQQTDAALVIATKGKAQLPWRCCHMAYAKHAYGDN